VGLLRAISEMEFVILIDRVCVCVCVCVRACVYRVEGSERGVLKLSCILQRQI
jgi:hypothetical protein